MVETPDLQSPRLRYRALTANDSNAFHALVTDDHIKHYLLDGQTMSADWSTAEIETSNRLFAERGVGIWLLFAADRPHSDPIGFAGFRIFAELAAEPQLLYALRASVTGQGYATEVAAALVAYAYKHAGFRDILAAADEPNKASIRVLEKVGFARCGETPGDFGTTLLFRHSGVRSPR